MAVVTIRDLAKRTQAILESVTQSGRPAVITRNGKPVAAVVPIDEEELEDWVLSTAPDLVRARQDADTDLAKSRTLSWDDLRDERTS